jgi:hypothetical protein
VLDRYTICKVLGLDFGDCDESILKLEVAGCIELVDGSLFERSKGSQGAINWSDEKSAANAAVSDRFVLLQKFG